MTAGAPVPDRSPVLARRVAAGLVDLTFVALTAAATAVVTSTRVPAIRQPDGSVTFSDADLVLLDGLTGPLSGGRLLGDTLWAFATVDVLTIIAATIAAGITVGALVPQLAGDRSPGKFLFRLRVSTVDGRPPGAIRHLARTLASPFDLMPLVVPGLTGFAFAASNPAHQRIGDRLAGTIVVDRQASDDMIPVAAALAIQARPRNRRPDRVVPTIRSATLVVDAPARLSPSVTSPSLTTPSLNRRPQPPDLDGDKVARPYPAPVRPRATPVGRHHGPPEPQPDGDTVDMNNRDSASEQSTPESTAEPVPVEERLNNPYPKPVRRSREVPEDPQLPDFDSLTLPESSLSDMPLTKDALFEALGLTRPAGTGDERSELATTELAATETADDERVDRGSIDGGSIDRGGVDRSGMARSRAASEQPIPAALAPIPAALAPKAVPTTGVGTAAEPARDAVAPTAPAAAPTSVSTTLRQGSSPAPEKRAPIWSEDWDAWIYWDTTLRTWFRHDMARGTWVPMDED